MCCGTQGHHHGAGHHHGPGHLHGSGHCHGFGPHQTMPYFGHHFQGCCCCSSKEDQLDRLEMHLEGLKQMAKMVEKRIERMKGDK